MSLSQRLYDKFEEWRTDFSHGLAGFLVTVLGRGVELTLDIVGKTMKPALMPMIDKVLADPDMPPEIKEIFTQLKTTEGQWQALVMGGMAGTAVGGVSSSLLGPIFEKVNQKISNQIRQFIFDYQFVLATHLRGLETSFDIFNDLRYRGYNEERIELLKQLLWLRLDPVTIQQIWLRDKGAYDHLWKDLHDQGWDEERIGVWKELAHIIPPLADMVRFADFGSFDPEIIDIWREFYDAPSWIVEPMSKIGITGEWANKYWFSHWRQPGRYELGLMRVRDYIDDTTVKNAYRTQGYSSYWQELLLKLAYEPFTRVDVRRMYKVEVLDQAGVKRAYMDLGYNEEKAQALTDFTLKYYARDEDKVEEEEEKIRDLTRADICDGYRRGIFTRAEADALLAQIHYTPESIGFYLDREDLKKDQALRDAYATNYRQLFVIGIKDAAEIKSEMVALGFLDGEVDQYLMLWQIERIRRQAKPSRTDLARFLKKQIITEETWRLAMADLGYADKYIDWYRADLEA